MSRQTVLAGLAGLMLLAAACSRPASDPGPKLNTAPITLEPARAPLSDGAYLVEPATGKVWKISPSPFPRLTWSRDGRTLLVNHEPVHNQYVADVLDLPAGAGLRLSGPGGTSLQGAALSPDGRQLAFLNPQKGLQVANRDGTGLRELGLAKATGDVHWAPDGARLAVAGSGAEFTPVHVVDLNGSAPGGGPAAQARPTEARLTTLAGEARWHWFAWAPDGGRLALTQKESVFVHAIAPAARVEIPWIAGSLTWSRDGAYLASNVENYGPGAVGSTLMVVQPGPGAQPRVLADTLRFVDWAPDSRQIAYISNGCAWQEFDLYTGRADTGEKRRLTHSPQQVKRQPAWSPRGEVIAYATLRSLMLVDVTTGQERTLLHVGAPPGLLRWSPDGRYLAFSRYEHREMGCKEE